MRFKIFSLATVLALSGAMIADAQARPRTPRNEPPPLTVYKRSYLEPSNQVAVGSEHSYVTQSTVLGAAFAARDAVGGASKIGETNRPTRFFAPGWTGPQFETFYTPPYPEY